MNDPNVARREGPLECLVGQRLPRPTRGMGSAATQTLGMGVQIGDVIFGREEYPHGWNDAKLTLLWRGNEKCVWLEQTRSSNSLKWSKPSENANWTLDCRDWLKLPNASHKPPDCD